METAMNELKFTVDRAKKYLLRTDKTVALRKRHVKALEEDIELVLGYEQKPGYEDTGDAALTLRLLARRVKRELEEEIDEVVGDVVEPVTQITVVEAPNKADDVKVQPLKLPTFGGDPTEFECFMQVYRQNILDNPRISESGKWIHLRESLKGEPFDLIKAIPQTEKTLKVALKLLDNVYGGDDRTVTELFQRIHDLQPASEDLPSLRMVNATIEGYLLSLEEYGHETDKDVHLRSIVLGKYPQNIIFQVRQARDTPLSEIRDRMQQLVLSREGIGGDAIRTQQGAAAASPSAHSARAASFGAPSSGAAAGGATAQPLTSAATGARSSRASRANPPNPPRCILCGDRHWPDECMTYPTAETRKRRCPERCIICLRMRHTGTPCHRERRCVYCDSLEHNRAFCPVKFPENPEAQLMFSESPHSPPLERRLKKGCFLTFIARVATRLQPQPLELRVVLDTAGSRTLITKSAAKKLRLRESTGTAAHLAGVNALQYEGAPLASDTVQLCTSQHGQIEVDAFIVDKIADDVTAPDLAAFRRANPQFDHIEIPPTGEGQPIDILLGGDSLIDIVLLDRGHIVDAENQLLATKLGWLILSRKDAQSLAINSNTVMFFTDEEHIRNLYRLDTVGLADLEKNDIEDEQRAIDQFYQGINFNGERYEVTLPWKESPPSLNIDFGLAHGRLRSLYKKLAAQPALLEQYNSILLQQLSDGVIEIVPATAAKPHLEHYIPHHPVVCPDKSTKVRLVYDASVRLGRSKRSLNDNIFKGIRWLNDLTQTLMRFRKFKIAVVGDIAKAFHQIGIKEKDRDALRFLWLKDITKPPTDDNLQILRFCRVAFGVVASPFLLHATITYHLDTQEQSSAVAIIRRDLYADNLVTSLPSTENPISIYDQTKQIFHGMAMNMEKWATNDPILRAHIPLQDQNPERYQSVLGLCWDTEQDTLSIKTPRPSKTKNLAPTKRNVLRCTAAIFDPLGWATPIVLKAKIFLRRLWRENTQWDRELPSAAQQEWHDICLDLSRIPRIRLPRVMIPELDEIAMASLELHTFVDASKEAYAIVVYLASRTEKPCVALIAAKSRLTPHTVVSIPRLELIALRLGCKFMDFIQQALQISPAKKVIWSDSKCALTWVTTPKLLPPAIERVAAAVKTHEIDEFRYVPSKLNRADIATRGATVDELQESNWWSGPQWVLEPNLWPEFTYEKTYDDEVQLFLSDEPINPAQQQPAEPVGIATLQISHFSTLRRLLRRTAYCIAAVNAIARNRFGRSIAQTEQAIDVLYAELKWLIWDQQRALQPRIKQRSGQSTIDKQRIFVDADGLIRCATRLEKSNLPTRAVNPPLLVKNSILTRLIILDIHVANKHAGVAHTLACLQQKYALPQARRQIFRALREHCFVCRRHFAQSYLPPPPAPLPEYRVTKAEYPFEATGVDYMGPYKVRLDNIRGAERHKRWIVVFTCTAIRAVHLEVVHDMTTEELLLAFRRFFARRGVPKLVVCDNAPQFEALNGIFQNVWPTFVAETSSYFMAAKIQFKFVPQHSPWMGGVYERVVQDVKRAMDRTYGGIILFHRQFETTILEIEGMLNVRPLTYVDRSLDSPLITPAQFLSLRFPAVPLANEQQPEDSHIHRLWRCSQQYLKQFWNNWSNQYLLQLRNRDDRLKNRTRGSTHPPAPGDIVLIADPEKRRSAWQLALVERLVPSEDGAIRAVQLRLPSGTRTLRPVVKLAPMDIGTTLPDFCRRPLTADRKNIVVSDDPSEPQPETSDSATKPSELQPQTVDNVEIVEIGIGDLDTAEDPQ